MSFQRATSLVRERYKGGAALADITLPKSPQVSPRRKVFTRGSWGTKLQYESFFVPETHLGTSLISMIPWMSNFFWKTGRGMKTRQGFIFPLVVGALTPASPKTRVLCLMATAKKKRGSWRTSPQHQLGAKGPFEQGAVVVLSWCSRTIFLLH